MIYVFTDTIPANTAKGSARTKTLKLTKGVIHRLSVHFPAGCNGLANVQLLKGVHHVFPTNTQGSFAGNNESIVFNEFHEIKSHPTVLTLRTWNTDTVYEHTVTVRIGLLPRFAVLPAGATEGLVESLKSLLVRRAND